MITVDQHVEDQMHQGAGPVADQQRPWMRQDHQEQERHELRRVKWKHQFSRTVGEVIAKEAQRTWPAPLLLEYEVVEIMVDIDQKTSGKTTGCGLYRPC